MTKNQELTVVNGIAAQVWTAGRCERYIPSPGRKMYDIGNPATHFALSLLFQATIEPLEDHEVDEFEFNFSSTEKPHVKNDTVTLNKKDAGDHEV